MHNSKRSNAIAPYGTIEYKLNLSTSRNYCQIHRMPQSSQLNFHEPIRKWFHCFNMKQWSISFISSALRLFYSPSMLSTWKLVGDAQHACYCIVLYHHTETCDEPLFFYFEKKKRENSRTHYVTGIHEESGLCGWIDSMLAAIRKEPCAMFYALLCVFIH